MAKVQNKVYQLSAATQPRMNVLTQSDNRKMEFESLKTSLTNDAPELGRDILLSSEIYDSNILKGTQESKKEKF